MRAVTMYRALVKASKGKPLTVERQRIRAHLDGMRQLFEGRAA